MKKLVIFALLLTLCVLPKTMMAQEASPDDASQISNTINFLTIPNMPGPDTAVHVTAQSFGLDLDSATETWQVNGARVAAGKGVTSINVTTGVVGSRTDISLDVDTGSGVVTRSFELAPGEVDILWQGDTYAPPFYKGRTLWSSESDITIVAIPHVSDSSGGETSPEGLIYRWTKDGTVLGSLSGTGKNSLSFGDSVLSLPTTVKVDVMSDNETVVGNASPILAAEPPLLLIYEDNPLYGLVLNNRIGDQVSLKDQEVSFTAMPYFAGVQSRTDSSLKYTWSAGGTNTPQTGSTVTYRAPAGSAGATNISANVANKNTVLQSASANFLVQFGNQQTF